MSPPFTHKCSENDCCYTGQPSPRGCGCHVTPGEMLKQSHADMLAVLEEVAEYLDRYADVIDGEDGQPEANDALRLLTAVNDLIRTNV